MYKNNLFLKMKKTLNMHGHVEMLENNILI